LTYRGFSQGGHDAGDVFPAGGPVGSEQREELAVFVVDVCGCMLIFALERGGHFLLIHDERNPSFAWSSTSIDRGAFALFYELLPASAQRRCHRITTQGVVEVVERVFPFPSLEEVRAKYIK
jgi:hypothetical protein